MNKYTVNILDDACNTPIEERMKKTRRYDVVGLKEARIICGIPLHWSQNAGGFWGYDNNRECFVYKRKQKGCDVMTVADAMRTISEAVADGDARFNEIYKDFIGKIKEEAEKGYREICFYEHCISYSEEKYDVYVNALKKKLLNDGFKIVKGYQIGKGISHSETTYVIWQETRWKE